MKTMTMKKLAQDNRGFCCCHSMDMMIVVAMIGILAAIAIPQFAELIRRSNEGATKGNLGAIRSALSTHYDDRGKTYPPNLALLTVVGIGGEPYLNEIPRAKTPDYHADSAIVTLIGSSSDLDDSGGWAYVAEQESPEWGMVLVNCTHTDTKDKGWSSY